MIRQRILISWLVLFSSSAYVCHSWSASPASSHNPPTPKLSFYNSKTRAKEPLEPISKDKISMYTCGPTVYDFAHIGNFRAFLTYDLIKRVLLYFGYNVEHICNLTDVDDKIINRANEQKIENISDLTLKFEKLFFEDLNALNIMPADRYPRATEHIDEMMDMILELRDKGLAYEAEDGSWYFATDKQEGYGRQLVDLNWSEMESTERGETQGKKNTNDFALWKAFKPDADREDASWESPDIKKGRPGWHLECSAMARKYLGDTIDIHGGGVDLKFPHHENEIAQSEGATGKNFCNCWMHNGFVNVNNEKMSKSLGNFLTLRGVCPRPDQVRAYRYLVLSSQYRNPLSFSDNVLQAAGNAVKRVDAVMSRIAELQGAEEGAAASSSSRLASKVVPAALANFEAALVDDLSMPRASAALFSLVKEAEKEIKKTTQEGAESIDIFGLKAIEEALLKMDQVFGIFYQVPAWDGESKGEDGPLEIPDEVLMLVDERAAAKEAKDWELADALRSRIGELGFQVKDVKGESAPIISRLS